MKTATWLGWFVLAAGISVLVFASCEPENGGGPGPGRPSARPTPPGDGGETPPAAKLDGKIEDLIRDAQAGGAAWLAAAQRDDGGWGGPKVEVGLVGVSGLVLEGLAGLPDDLRAKHGDVIEKGVAFLLKHQQDDGSIVRDDDKSLSNYRTAIAIRALVAVDPKKEKYGETIDAGVQWLKSIQAEDGSIGYGSHPEKGGDVINTTETLESLRQAGVPEDDPVVQKALGFLRRLQNLDEAEGDDLALKTTNDGGGIYRADRSISDASKAGTTQLPDGTPAPKSYGSATYALLKGYLFSGLKKDHPRVLAARNWLGENWTVSENPEMGAQGLYYYWYTMARTLGLWAEPTFEAKGKDVAWAEELARAVVTAQRDDGSWENELKDRWWENNPNLATAYAVNVLNICQDVVAEE
jgi:squalene-hopene/tetraprenyl-beta-curcumene cyclase